MATMRAKGLSPDGGYGKDSRQMSGEGERGMTTDDQLRSEGTQVAADTTERPKCPIRDDGLSCIEERCAWWMAPVPDRVAGCAVAVIARQGGEA